MEVTSRGALFPGFIQSLKKNEISITEKSTLSSNFLMEKETKNGERNIIILEPEVPAQPHRLIGRGHCLLF